MTNRVFENLPVPVVSQILVSQCLPCLNHTNAQFPTLDRALIEAATTLMSSVLEARGRFGELIKSVSDSYLSVLLQV